MRTCPRGKQTLIYWMVQKSLFTRCLTTKGQPKVTCVPLCITLESKTRNATKLWQRKLGHKTKGHWEESVC